MLTCREASQLMSQSFDRRLGLMERLGLRIHLALCDSCRTVHKQLEILHRFCRRVAADPGEMLSMQPGLSAEAQERILKELHRKQDG